MNTDTVNTDTNATVAAPAAETSATADVLGGTTDTTATETVATETTATPGKVARAARKANNEKRTYTPRGTTYWARRVILLNGEPVGRGRPAKDGKGERKVVYVPVGMEYDAAVHGEGVRYNSHTHNATHKRIAKDSVSYTFDDGVKPTVKPTKATKAVKSGKSKTGKGKSTKPAKKSGKKNKPTVVPVADVPASAVTVETAPAVEVPVASTDAVTA